MLIAAGIVVYAAQFSDFGKGTSTVSIEGVRRPAQASPIAVRLANAVGRASLGRRHRTLDMTRVAPFAWTRVYVFAGDTSEGIRRRLGFDWKGAPATVPRSGQEETLIAFVSGQRVVGSAFFEDAIGHLDCLTAPGGYQRGTRFVVRFAHGSRAPYVVATPADVGEAACLRAVGVR